MCSIHGCKKEYKHNPVGELCLCPQCLKAFRKGVRNAERFLDGEGEGEL